MSRRITKVSEEKKEYERKLNSLFDKYSRLMFVSMDNVRSQQVHDVRLALRGKAVLIMGKKTLQRKIFENRADRDDASANDKAFYEKANEKNLLRHNTGLLFTSAEPNEIISILDKHRVQAPARVGAIAPCDVVINAQQTSLEPTQTSFFQALSIPTKITKGAVEIITDKKVLTAGDRVDNSTAVLLLKLKIFPFYYQIEVMHMWDRGVIFEQADLKVTDESLEQALLGGIQNVAAVSLGAGIPTAASMPVIAADCFKNLLAACVATNYSFDEFGAAETIKNAREGKLAAAAPAAAAPAAAAAAAAPAAKKEEKKPEPEEDDEDDIMGGLF